tara:strand:+ start:18132 stop:18419 length:288 start_codon:yes stop_codon:yes gene_type:complete
MSWMKILKDADEDKYSYLAEIDYIGEWPDMIRYQKRSWELIQEGGQPKLEKNGKARYSWDGNPSHNPNSHSMLLTLEEALTLLPRMQRMNSNYYN